MLDFLAGHSAYSIYFLLFVLLFLCGLGFPMAEELVLLAGGVLVASKVLSPIPMLLATLAGVVIGDMVLFWLGHGLASHLGKWPWLQHWLAPESLEKGKTFFALHGKKTVFLARFVTGFRAPTFLLAGTLHMSLWRFVLMDLLAGLIFVPLVCFLGYVFADRFDFVTAWFRNVERGILTLLVLSGICWLLWYGREKRAGDRKTSHTGATHRS